MSSEDLSVNEYHLSIIAVKMKVKFPCRMKLEHCSNPITEEVASTDGSKFVFNQDVTIQEEAEKDSVDCNIVLITEKGAKYVSGVMKLYHKEMSKSEGQKIICPLIKCLDNEAYCQLKINKIKIGKNQKRVSVSNTLQLKRLNSNQVILNGTEQKKLLSPKTSKSPAVQTRSEFGLGGVNGVKTFNDWQDTRSKGAAQTLIYRSSFLKSPKSKKPYAMLSPKSRQLIPDSKQYVQYQILSQRQKLSSQSQVYKQGYQKLKQKYKKQSQSLKSEQTKRLQLQANENNYKIEQMRLKLKTQQQQRIITQKNEKINQLQIAISEINRKQLDMDYLKEENKNLEEKVCMLNDVVNSLKKENEVLKKLTEEKTQNDKQIISELRQELDAYKQKLEQHSIQYSETLKQKTQQILSLTTENKSKAAIIEQEKIEIQKLQTHIQSKIYEFEKTLQQQKNQSTQASNQLKQRIDLIERQRSQLEKRIQQSTNDKQKMKNLILKAEYDKKILIEQQKVIKNELLQYKILKQKHSEQQKQLKFLSEDKFHLSKLLQSTKQSKEINLKEINEQSQLQINYFKKQSKDFQEKYKALAGVKIQLQSQIQVAKHSIDRQKRQIESLTQDLTDQKNAVKELKQYSTLLQQQNLSLQNQVSLSSNKMRFGEQTSRFQLQKYRNQLERTKNELAAQNSRAVQLFELKSNLQIQLNKNRIQIQYHEDKIDKLFTSNKEYQSNIEYLMKEHEAQVNDLQQTISKNENQIKNDNELIHKGQLEKLSFTQKLENAKKQQKIAEQKISHLESQLKARSEELIAGQERFKEQQSKLSNLQNDHSALKHEHSVLKNDKNKVQKMLQIKKEEIQTLKKDIAKLNQEKEGLQQVETQLREEIKKTNESSTKTEMKLKATDREYTKFKELMGKTIKSQFAKLPLLGNTTFDNQKVASSSPSRNIDESKASIELGQLKITPQQILKQTLTTAVIHSNLISSITDSKTTLFKLIEHNKQLKKQIQSLSEQSQSSSNKYQFTQIQLHKDIQELQQELKQVYEQKQEEQITNDKLILDLNTQIHEKNNLCDQLEQQIQELEYALTTLKLDFETNNNKNDKKCEILKSNIGELQQRIQFYKMSLSNQQDINHELQEKVQMLKTEKEELLEIVIKNKVLIEDLTYQKEKLQSTLSETAKDRKTILENYNSLEIQFNESKDLKSKTKQLLEDQQRKTVELKEFVTTLMKQKQNVIKSQLQKSDRILELQTQQIQLKRDLQINAQDQQRLKSELEDAKQKLRKQLANSKNLEASLSQTLGKNRKIVDKLQEREKEITMKDQIISRLDKKYKELTEKNYKQTLELHQQIDSKYSQNINISKELNQKILLLEAKIQELQHNKAKQHHENVLTSDELLAEKEQTELFRRQIKSLQAQLEQSHEELRSLAARNQQLTTDIEQREQQLSSLNDRIIILQGELEALNKDRALKLEQLNTDWLRKYEQQIQQYEQKLQILINEKEMIRYQLQQKINQLEVSNNQNKNSEIGIVDIKKNCDEKVKKLENDRLSTILAKNNDIKKLTEENKVLQQSIKKLQVNLKENSQLLDNLRKRLINEEKLRKESDEKLKTQKKVQQAQLAQLLSKELKYKQQRQQLYQTIWSNERQVRKICQNYVKKILDQCDHNHIDKITNQSKGLQSQIVKAMTLKINIESN